MLWDFTWQHRWGTQEDGFQNSAPASQLASIQLRARKMQMTEEFLSKMCWTSRWKWVIFMTQKGSYHQLETPDCFGHLVYASRGNTGCRLDQRTLYSVYINIFTLYNLGLYHSFRSSFLYGFKDMGTTKQDAQQPKRWASSCLISRVC